MKVLERKEWSKEVTCHGCKSKLALEKDDIMQGQFGSMGDYETEYYAKCVVCETEIRLGDWYRAGLPPIIMNSARRSSDDNSNGK